MLIFETQDFIVESADKPHVSREDGGHIRIKPKRRVRDRQGLSPREAIEFMRLSIVVGEAMAKVLNERGVDVGRINYQDNGNWSVFKPEGPYFHLHLYGRAKSARVQIYGEALNCPSREKHPEFYENFKPLDDGDIEGIKKEIERLFSTEKYSDSAWGL